MEFKLNPNDFPSKKPLPKSTITYSSDETQELFPDEIIEQKPYTLNQKEIIEVMQANVENIILTTRILASDIRKSNMNIMSFDIASLKTAIESFENLNKQYKEIK